MPNQVAPENVVNALTLGRGDPVSPHRERLLSASLISGFRSVDLLVVESRHARDLDSITDGLTFIRFDPSSRPQFWCFHFWIRRLFFVLGIPKEVRTLVAVARTLRVRAIISSDAYDVLDTASMHLPRVSLYFVQHGLYLDQRRLTVKRKPEIPDKSSRITLFALGKYDIDNYRKRGIRPLRIIPVGTLKNSVYVRNHMPSNRENEFDICIIEKGIVPSPKTAAALVRRDAWESFLMTFDDYCRQSKPKVVIALSDGDDRDSVISWIRDHFCAEFSVTNHADPYATYRAVDSSNITIGQGSTVLCEALSRGKKCLSVDYSGTGFWELPGEGIHQLVAPSLEELSARITLLLGLGWESYSRLLPSELLDLVSADPRTTIDTINLTIKADLAH